MILEEPRAGNEGKGTCYALFAYDVGLSLNLAEADRRITAVKERIGIRHKRRAPYYFDYRPTPLRVRQAGEPLAVGHTFTRPVVDVVLYDFGAISVSYAIPTGASFEELQALSEALYDNATLLADSRRRVEQLLEALHVAVEKPSISSLVEDYIVFHIDTVRGFSGAEFLLAEHGGVIAQVLRSETATLSAQEVQDATASRISFALDDVTVMDWNAALVIGREMEDVLAVLEFANVELLEMRYLDRQLDDALDQAFHALTRRRVSLLAGKNSFTTDLKRIAQLQVESVVLFERVTNAHKLVGDQFLARVYRLMSLRFHLAEWDATVLRKLQTLESIYGKMSDNAAAQRMEMLEWIIIVLITISIVITFMPGIAGH